MISALSWIPKGAMKPVPEVADPPSNEEIEEMIKSGALDLSEFNGAEREEEEEEEEGGGEGEDGGGDEEMEVDAENQSQKEQVKDEVSQALAVVEALGRVSKKGDKWAAAAPRADDVADGLKELDMDHYDDEDDDGIELFSKGLGDLYYPSNEIDPYLKDKDDADSEEIEDMTIQPNDSVVVCARNEDEFSHLEIWVLEESNDGDSNMYVHHDIVLSAFPLCMAWLDCPIKGGDKGNFIAVGSMDPSIEIWDLDIIDEVQPAVELGGIAEKKKKKKKGRKASIKYKEGSHTNSVLGLAWNKEYRNCLASASADKTVKIWNVDAGKCDLTMEHHTDKVQAVAWNHHQSRVLLSGSFDHSVVMRDVGAMSNPGFRWSVEADVESLAWDPHNSYSFVVSLENGIVHGFDIRVATSNSASDSKPSFTLHAHDKAVCAVSYNPSAPNLLATGSTDKMVKLWDLSNNQPSCVASRNPKMGGVFSISFSEDSPFLLAMGGSKGKLELWDTLSEAGVARKFGNYSKFNRTNPET